MKLFVGLDVSLAKTAVCVLTEHGKIAMEIEVTSEPELLIAMLQDPKAPPKRSDSKQGRYHNGCMGQWPRLACQRS